MSQDDPEATETDPSRLREQLEQAHQQICELEAENETLREELRHAGEMLETLAQDLERPLE